MVEFKHYKSKLEYLLDIIGKEHTDDEVSELKVKLLDIFDYDKAFEWLIIPVYDHKLSPEGNKSPLWIILNLWGGLEEIIEKLGRIDSGIFE